MLGQSGERMEQFTLEVSTYRGRTWTTRSLGVASDFGALWNGGAWDLHFRAQPDDPWSPSSTPNWPSSNRDWSRT